MNISKIFATCTFVSTFLVAMALASCGSPDKKQESAPSGPIRVAWPAEDRQALVDGPLPPFELNAQSFVGSGRFNSVFWLDFEGATVTAEESFIVKNAGLTAVVIPAFAPADINSLVDRQNLILSVVADLVPFFPDIDIKLTLTKPAFGTFSRLHIGGNNFTGKDRVLGIAPLDLGNRLGNDVLFVFPRELKRNRTAETAKIELSHVIAHEIAHALGARHIDNDLALMKPSVSSKADTFNVNGPVVDAPKESENSQQILLKSAGSRSLALVNQDLPTIVGLDAFSTNNVIQYTVLSTDNFAKNLGIDLTKLRYQWELEGKLTEGTSVLLAFPDRKDHILNLTVSNESGASRSFQFSVGHRK